MLRISDWSSYLCSSVFRFVEPAFERLFARAPACGRQDLETRPPRAVRPEYPADRRDDGADAHLCEEPAAAGEDRQNPRAGAYHRRGAAREYSAHPAEDIARACRC